MSLRWRVENPLQISHFWQGKIPLLHPVCYFTLQTGMERVYFCTFACPDLKAGIIAVKRAFPNLLFLLLGYKCGRMGPERSSCFFAISPLWGG